jgi:hypothetical protein
MANVRQCKQYCDEDKPRCLDDKMEQCIQSFVRGNPNLPNSRSRGEQSCEERRSTYQGQCQSESSTCRSNCDKQ